MLRKPMKSKSKKKTKDVSDGDRKVSSELMERLRNYVRTRGSEYLKDHNISSVGIGYKKKDGKPTREIALQFTVNQKSKPEELERLGTVPIPESISIAGQKIPTDVIQRKYTTEYRLVAEVQTSDRKKRKDPIYPGISIANVNVSAGSIGCIVYDRDFGTPYVLSNWHVLHGPKGTIGDDIAQPGPFDDNRAHLNRMGKLVRSHIGHAGDCAIATIDGRGINSTIVDLHTIVATIGEPELGDKVVKSGRTTGVTHGIVSRVHTIAKLDYGGSVGEQEIGCFEIELDPNNPPANGEVSMGGDSGSVWLFKSGSGQPTNVMAGLHFAGEGPSDPNEHAIACYPKSVFEKLQISLSPPSQVESVPGTGFAQDFLSIPIELPKITAINMQLAFKMNGSEVIKYTHFSLALNKVRRFAFWVGWNIDGGNIKKAKRKGIPFVFDPNIPKEFQVGDEVYGGNRLDRGHIARRADLVWGGLPEAKRANKDSFFFTNIAPQMETFNQSKLGGLWGLLEDAVFENTDVENLKVSIFGGPVFRENDPEFRGAKLPREFWKVIAFVEDQKLKAKAFLLTQNLDELEAFDLDQFKVFQVALTEIEGRCGLKFAAVLKAADSVAEHLRRQPVALSERKPLGSLDDIDWS
ncbi:MAG TPA: DNA/RNA non-specific endonuclease [Nitrososphaeraceae archaeon]|nr:DNA/RNA non-specific endonuclease [Nitrososphaeraceae archaeon]